MMYKKHWCPKGCGKTMTVKIYRGTQKRPTISVYTCSECEFQIEKKGKKLSGHNESWRQLIGVPG